MSTVLQYNYKTMQVALTGTLLTTCHIIHDLYKFNNASLQTINLQKIDNSTLN